MRTLLVLLLSSLAFPVMAATGMSAGSYTIQNRFGIDQDFQGDASSGTFGAFSTFGLADVGTAANSLANLNVKKAAASFTSPSSDISGLTNDDFGHPSYGLSDTVFVGGSIYQYTAVKSFGTSSDVLLPSQTSLARYGIFFDRSVSVDLQPDLDVAKSYMRGFADYYGVGNQQTIKMDVASLFSVSSMSVNFYNMSNFNDNISFVVASQRSSTLRVEGSVFDIDNDLPITTIQTEEAFNSIAITRSDGVGGITQNYFRDDRTGTDPLFASDAYVTGIDYFLRGGQQYQLSVSVGCDILVADAAAYFAGSSASCDADRSGYWNGIVSARDENGQLITNFDLIGESGFNYRYASPLSPALDPALVPEPASWALLIAGFCLVFVTRQRSSNALNALG